MTLRQETEWMAIAIEEAQKAPWPFGAVIVIGDKVVAQAGSGDSGVDLHDPTAHAEVNVIRLACKNSGINDLRDKDALMVASC